MVTRNRVVRLMLASLVLLFAVALVPWEQVPIVGQATQGAKSIITNPLLHMGAVSISPAFLLAAIVFLLRRRLSAAAAEELVGLAGDSGVIAEGIRLLPHLVKPLLADPGHAVWLLPTPEFRVAAVDSRRTGWEFLRKTTDPERARRNLLEGDRMFTDELLEETKRLELPIVEVDIAMTEDDLSRRLAQAFGLSDRKS